MKVIVLIIAIFSYIDAINNDNNYISYKNIDLLNKSGSLNWLLESSFTKSKMACLARCKQLSCACTNAFFYPNQALNAPDCYLYSRNFSLNELTFSNISNMFTKGKKILKKKDLNNLTGVVTRVKISDCSS